MCLAQGPQRSDVGEAWTRGLSVSSQALYHWATALPMKEPVQAYYGSECDPLRGGGFATPAPGVR